MSEKINFNYFLLEKNYIYIFHINYFTYKINNKIYFLI